MSAFRRATTRGTDELESHPRAIQEPRRGRGGNGERQETCIVAWGGQSIHFGALLP